MPILDYSKKKGIFWVNEMEMDLYEHNNEDINYRDMQVTLMYSNNTLITALSINQGKPASQNIQKNSWYYMYVAICLCM